MKTTCMIMALIAFTAISLAPIHSSTTANRSIAQVASDDIAGTDASASSTIPDETVSSSSTPETDSNSSTVSTDPVVVDPVVVDTTPVSTPCVQCSQMQALSAISGQLQLMLAEQQNLLRMLTIMNNRMFTNSMMEVPSPLYYNAIATGQQTTSLNDYAMNVAYLATIPTSPVDATVTENTMVSNPIVTTTAQSETTLPLFNFSNTLPVLNFGDNTVQQTMPVLDFGNSDLSTKMFKFNANESTDLDINTIYDDVRKTNTTPVNTYTATIDHSLT